MSYEKSAQLYDLFDQQDNEEVGRTIRSTPDAWVITGRFKRGKQIGKWE